MNKEQFGYLISNSESKLDSLRAVGYDGLKGYVTQLESTFKEFKEGGNELFDNNNTLQIGIVGQVKAGKSSFLNSLFFNGEDVLPKASTPMTAGLTIIEYADSNVFVVEYFNENDWEVFVRQDEDYKLIEQEVRKQEKGAPESIIRKEIDSRTSEKVRSAHEMVAACGANARQKIGSKEEAKSFSDLKDLQNVLERYVGASGEYTSVVKSLYIKMNDARLKGLRIVDTPGVNDPVISRENRTRTFLHSCHGVFLLSASTDFMGSGDVGFLNSRIGGSGIGSVVILASKFDSVLQDIGADREMKNEPKGDLVDTVELQTKKFKQRLRQLSDTIDENLRGKMKLDTTAGIGYSIAEKPSDKWDDVEKQIVKQMKRYYPDYFSTEADVKETFKGLANISDIKDKYLDGVFLNNKETIIQEKVKNFFSRNGEQVADEIENILREFKERREELNATSVAEIQQQKEIQGRLFKELDDEFRHIFKNFQENLQDNVKQISNDIEFNEIRDIPLEKTTSDITHKGWLWGHNTNEFDYYQINCLKLGANFEGAVKTYAESWNQKWAELFNATLNKISERLTNSISEFEVKIMSSSFNDSYYRKLIGYCLEDIGHKRILSIGEIKKDYTNKGYAEATRFVIPSSTYNVSKGRVIPILNSALDNHIKFLKTRYITLAESIRIDIRKEIDKKLKEVVEQIEGLKLNFSGNLKKEGEQYLNQLEKDLLDKVTVLNDIDEIIKYLTELSVLYKNKGL
ncbi:dynamin family protein [Prevotella sp. HUN102]|uniref:dynamin family protein n=1 Tax=Prevotella sp. HUN102 TaxID=1392486 RepID=UPI00048E21F8|nr:dynamin family protein [Prevotella sp. HUN102]